MTPPWRNTAAQSLRSDHRYWLRCSFFRCGTSHKVVVYWGWISTPLKPLTTALASRLRRFHRPGLARPATQLAIGASSGSPCNGDRLAPRCANLIHPLFGAQHAFDQGRHVQVCIQLGPMQAKTGSRDFDVPKVSGFGAGQAVVVRPHTRLVACRRSHPQSGARLGRRRTSEVRR